MELGSPDHGVWCRALLCLLLGILVQRWDPVDVSCPPSITPCSVPLRAKARKQQWFICSFFNLVLKHVYACLQQRRGQKGQCHCKDYPDVCLHSVFHMDSSKLLFAIIYFSAFLYTCSYQYLALRTSLFLFPLLSSILNSFCYCSGFSPRINLLVL